MKKILFISILVGFTISVNAQIVTPFIKWQKSFGGTGNDDATSIQQTIDGGYIIAGSTSSNDSDVTINHGSGDYWIVKIDTIGNIQWQKSYGGSNNDVCQSIMQTIDKGYIIVGNSLSNDGDVSGHHGNANYSDYWVVKVDSIGNIQWQKSLGGTDTENAYSIIQTNDGGYIVAGMTQSNDGDVLGNHGGQDFWIVKLDTIGNIQWQKPLGGSFLDAAFSIQQTNDGGYIVAGYSYSNDGDVSGHHGNILISYDCWIVKLDSVGNIQWQKSLGGTDNESAYSIQQTIDSGYIVAGHSMSNDGDVTGHHGAWDYWVVKLDTSGNIQWQKSLGGTNHDWCRSVTQTNDGGYIVAGWAGSNDGDVTDIHIFNSNSNINNDMWIVKLDILGNIQWKKCFGGNAPDYASSIKQTNDGGYIIAGSSGSNDGDVTGNHGGNNYWVVKLNPFYNISGTFTYDDILNTLLDSVWVYLMQNGNKLDSTQTDLNGHYQFNVTNNGTYNITATTHKAWGGVNVTDAIKCKRHFAGAELLNSSIRLHAGDVDNSFLVNPTDAVKITRRYSGADTSFTRGDWVFEKPFGGDTINVSIYMNDTVIVNGANIVQNFKGLCVGDVNGSYNSIPIGQKSMRVESGKLKVKREKARRRLKGVTL